MADDFEEIITNAAQSRAAATRSVESATLFRNQVRTTMLAAVLYDRNERNCPVQHAIAQARETKL